MRSFYMRIFKNIICIYVLALCCFAYATMIHAIPDHVYVQEGQKLELDKKIPCYFSVIFRGGIEGVPSGC